VSARLDTATGTLVGLIGLGAMGVPVAEHLMRAGHEVVGFDVAADRVDELEGLGGQRGGSVEEVASRSRAVLTLLPSPAALADVCDRLVAAASVADGPRPDVIELSTLGYETKVGARARLADVGISMLDGALSGTAVQAASGDLIVYVSGDRITMKRCRDVVATIGRAVHDLGAFGNATRTKLVANHLVSVHIAAAAEALLLAQRCGLDPAAVLGALTDGAGTSRMLEVRGPMMAATTYQPPSMRLELFLKDVALIESLGRGVGSPTPLFDVAARFFRGAVEEGRAREDTSAVYSWLADQPPDAGAP
jgi:3-hydroxyisobutyrate dehydrogenase-like beta-hydroxyacid dehydrogenase